MDCIKVRRECLQYNENTDIHLVSNSDYSDLMQLARITGAEKICLLESSLFDDERIYLFRYSCFDSKAWALSILDALDMNIDFCFTA